MELDFYESIVETLMSVRRKDIPRHQFMILATQRFRHWDEFDLGAFQFWLDSYWPVED